MTTIPPYHILRDFNNYSQCYKSKDLRLPRPKRVRKNQLNAITQRTLPINLIHSKEHMCNTLYIVITIEKLRGFVEGLAGENDPGLAKEVLL